MKIITFDEIDSTNSYIKRNFEELEDKTVVIAKAQTAGYGRFKRNWVDLGENNLFLSMCLKHSEFLPVFSNLTQYTSLYLAETFSEFGIKPDIKWPNDILIDGKKVAGILAEAVFKNSEFYGVVLGVGVNLNSKHEDILKIDKAATALNLELNSEIDINIFIEVFLSKFFYDYDKFLQNGFKLIKNKYLSFVNFFGNELTITQPSSKIVGIAKSINDEGHLILDVNGEDMEITTGDVN